MIPSFGASEKTRDSVPLRKEVRKWVEAESQRATRSSRTTVREKVSGSEEGTAADVSRRDQKSRELVGCSGVKDKIGLAAFLQVRKSVRSSMLMLCRGEKESWHE